MTTQLTLYNEALSYIGEDRLASLSDAVPVRYKLDDVWDSGKVIDYWLEQGFWNFAIRTRKFEYDGIVEPSFGYQYAYEKPDDYIRLVNLTYDEFFRIPIQLYDVEAEYFYCDVDPIYMRYISNHDDYGNNIGEWPQTFTRYCASYMAERIAPFKTQSESRLVSLQKQTRRFLVDARSKDAMDQPALFSPAGNWAKARTAGRGDSSYLHGRKFR